MKRIQEECLICGALLEYLEKDVSMECAICHKSVRSKTRCVRGHFVCDDCHRQGLDAVTGVCLRESSRNPAAVLEKLMAMDFCHMHGPEHHVMVGAALLTAYRNAGGSLDLAPALEEMLSRGKAVPGGACGFWGACGAAISAGIFISVLTGATPLSGEAYGLSNRMTAAALQEIGGIGGPRCCKRNSYLTLRTAVRFVRETFHVEMELPDISCDHSPENNQCLRKSCPFFRGGSLSEA